MRLFLITYPGSGTHQIMPALNILPNIEDRSRSNLLNMPAYVGLCNQLNEEGIKQTAKELSTFQGSAFGHLAFVPEYADALTKYPTKVIFNVRDPRDVIVSEYHKMLKFSQFEPERKYWLDFKCADGKYVHEKDIIETLIEFSAARWPQWLPWLKFHFVKAVKFEDLRSNGEETLRMISEWVYPHLLPDPKIMIRHLPPRPNNPTFRRGAIGEWKETFTDKQKELSNKLLGDIIRRLGYEN